MASTVIGLGDHLDCSTAVRTYSRPSASVNASSSFASAPASCMWYPDTEIELNLGMCSDV